MRKRQSRSPSETSNGPAKVVLVCSSGGHLAQLYQLQPWWEQRERLWVTFEKADAVSLLRSERVEWAHHPTTRNLHKLLQNCRLSWKVLRQHRPDVIVSSGAAVAFPFFVVARLLGIATVYLEVYDRISSPTLTGKLCYPLSDLFLLQWEEQQRFYPRGLVIGRVI